VHVYTDKHTSLAVILFVYAQVSQLTEQLVHLQLKARSEFDERMEKDIHRLREDSQREMDALRMHSKELADRENR
jgi:hypothetical protein